MNYFMRIEREGNGRMRREGGGGECRGQYEGGGKVRRKGGWEMIEEEEP